MIFLRNPYIARGISLLLLVVFGQSLVAPTVALALTHGSHQPEYTSYEEAGTTDMVNLLTGDFTYNLPILEVPGPEGSFSLPLSYHAGIGTDQESSWVGLGWNMNAGAIVRNVVEFPDDADGQVNQISRDNDVTRGWNANIPVIGQIGWDSNVGHFGTISLLGLAGASYENGSLTGGNLVGVHFNSTGVNVDPVGVISAAATIATAGLTSGASFVGNLAKQAASSAVIGSAITLAAGVPAPSFNLGSYWQLSQRNQKKLFHTKYWVWLDQTRYENMYGVLNLGNMASADNVDPGETPSVEGPIGGGGTQETVAPIYSDPNDVDRQGAASDMHYYYNGDPYYETEQPTSLAKDYFSVQGVGVSGVIEPYRLDVGGLSMPRQMSPKHLHISAGRFVNNNSNSPNNYKVGFKYQNAPSNSYVSHAGGTAPDVGNPQYSIQTTVGNDDPTQNTELIYSFNPNDPTISVFKNSLVGNQMEGDRYGLVDNQLAYGKQVEWYSHQELVEGTADIIDYFDYAGTPNRADLDFEVAVQVDEDAPRLPFPFNPNVRGFKVGKEGIQYFSEGETVTIVGRYYLSSNPSQTIPFTVEATIGDFSEDAMLASLTPWPEEDAIIIGAYTSIIPANRTEVVNSSIGGFKVTKEDGMTYHYTLPVYEWSNYSYLREVGDPDNTTKLLRASPFATSWLLTAITGSDYYDTDGDGIPSQEDWGYWTRMDYGKFSDHYQWRMPYEGTSRSADGVFDTFRQGVREQYYLEAVHTRSHTALFVKDFKNDGHGASSVRCSEDGIIKRGPASSLRLKEVVLLTNEKYEELLGAGLSPATGGDRSGDLLTSADSFSDILDPSDLTTLQESINRDAQKRVVFNYDYSLCPATVNSFNNANYCENGLLAGKLSLKSLSIFGRNGAKPFPDYQFAYESNSSYDQDSWDGWGMYTSLSNHQVNQDDVNPDRWSLTSVTTPLGSTIDISYERDDYASIAGIDLKETSGTEFYRGDNPGLWECHASGNARIFIDNTIFEIDDPIEITYRLDVQGQDETCDISIPERSGMVTSTVINKGTDPGTGLAYVDVQSTPLSRYCSNCIDDITGSSGSIVKKGDLTINRKGGNLRVSSIAVQDENNNTYETRYRYIDAENASKSSGVVAQEPDYVKSSTDDDIRYPFYQLFDWPFTPVMYGRVEVLQGPFATEDDYHTKQVYAFQTPDEGMITVNSTYVDDTRFEQIMFRQLVLEFLTKKQFSIDVNTSQIGQLKSIETFKNDNGTDQIASNTTLSYTGEIASPGGGNQGKFTESTLMIEKLVDVDDNAPFLINIHRAFRTTKVYRPSVLQSTTTIRDGFTSEERIISRDFFTGGTLLKESTDPLGVAYQTLMTPAYFEYPDMEPAVMGGHHMLSQMTGETVYKMDAPAADGIRPVKGVVSASVNTWKNTWDNYREVAVATGDYVDGNSEAYQPWRQHESYVWKGVADKFQSDGTYDPDPDEFNFDFWSDPTGWEKVSTVDRYDVYGMPLQVNSIGDVASATKMDNNSEYLLARGSYAEFTEMTFASAEDYQLIDGLSVPDVHYVEGEVRIASPNDLSTVKAHAGQYALELTAGETGFVYRTQPGTYDRERLYRVSVWADAPEAIELYYRDENGNDETVQTGVSAVSSGDWYLYNFTVDPSTLTGANPLLEVGVRARAGNAQAVYVDDFRFQPINGDVASYIYNEDGELTHTFNSHNLYMRYEYDDAGRLRATYQEYIDGQGQRKEVLVSKSQYNPVP